MNTIVYYCEKNSKIGPLMLSPGRSSWRGRPLLLTCNSAVPLTLPGKHSEMPPNNIRFFYPYSNSVFRNLIQLLFQADAPGI